MTFFSDPDQLTPAERLWSQRASITIGVRIVDNGVLIYTIGQGQGPGMDMLKAPPERVAVTLDQAVEHFREMLSRVWPQGAK